MKTVDKKNIDFPLIGVNHCNVVMLSTMMGTNDFSNNSL